VPNQTKTNSYLANRFIRRGERRENLKGNVVDCQSLDYMLDREPNESANDWDTIDLLERHVLSVHQDQALEQIRQLGNRCKEYWAHCLPNDTSTSQNTLQVYPGTSLSIHVSMLPWNLMCVAKATLSQLRFQTFRKP
jgi:hypothetical protein